MDDYTDQLQEEAAQAKADKYNCQILNANDFTLQLDLDTEEAWEAFPGRLGMLEERGLIPEDYRIDTWFSKSGNHHVAIYLADPLPVERRILLQALLGSDLKREALNLSRVDLGITDPIKLFRPRIAWDGEPEPLF